MVGSSDHKVACPIVSSTPFPADAQMSSSAPYSRTPSAYVPPSIWDTKPHTYTQQQTKLQFCISRYLCFWYHSHPKSSINIRFCLFVFSVLTLVRQMSGYYTKIGRGSLLKILTHLTLLKLRYLIQWFAICMRVDGEWVVTGSVCGPLSCGAVAVREYVTWSAL